MKTKRFKRICLTSVIGLFSLMPISTFILPNNSYRSNLDLKTSKIEDYDYTKNDFDFTKQQDIIDKAKVSAFDPRKTENYLTPVKNQGSEGLCWSYAAMAAAEISILKSGMWKGNPEMLDLSEKNLDWNVNVRNGQNDLLDLNEQDRWSKVLGKGNSSQYATQTLTQWLSPVNEKMHNGTNMHSYINPDYKVQNAIYIPLHRDSEGYVDNTNPISIAWMKQAIMKYGALTASFEVTKSSHANDTYYNTNCIKDEGSSGHVITIVGWDDNIEANKYYPEAKVKGGWICKNSWGKSFQEEGYFYMSYDSSLRDIIAYQYMPSSYTYQNNYYWDSPTESSLIDKFRTTKKAINIFPVRNASNNTHESVDGIQVGINGINSTIKINIYDDIDIDMMQNPNHAGFKLTKPALTKQVSFPMPGVYTVNLEDSVPVMKGKYFGVEVEIVKGENGPSYQQRVDDISSFMVATGTNTTSQDDLSYIFDNESNHYIRSNSIQDSNNVVRIRALTNTSATSNHKTNDISFAKLKLDRTSLFLDDIDTYPTFKSLMLEQEQLDINDFNITYKQSLWDDVVVYRDNKMIGRVEVTITPKKDTPYIGSLKTYLNVIVGRAPNINGLGHYENIGTNDYVQKHMGIINLYAGPSIKKYSDFKLPTGFKWSHPNNNVDVNNITSSLYYSEPQTSKFYRTTSWEPNNIKITKKEEDVHPLEPISLIKINNHSNEQGVDSSISTVPNNRPSTPMDVPEKQQDDNPPIINQIVPNQVIPSIPDKSNDSNNSSINVVMLSISIVGSLVLLGLTISFIVLGIKHHKLKKENNNK